MITPPLTETPFKTKGWRYPTSPLDESLAVVDKYASSKLHQKYLTASRINNFYPGYYSMEMAGDLFHREESPVNKDIATEITKIFSE